MRNNDKRAVILLAGLLIFSSVLTFLPNNKNAFATVPTQIQPDTTTLTSNYMFYLKTYDSYVKLGSNFYADGFEVSDSRVNFTNTALVSATMPVQTFGTAVQSGNATLGIIANSAVSYTMSCTVSAVCYAYYYYTDTAPIAVTTVQGSTITTIPSSSYTTNFTTFTNAASPAVYNNVSGKYLEAKITYTNPSTIIFDLVDPFIYFNIGAPTYIHSITITEVSASNIPAAVNVYVSSDGTTWGSPVKSVSLTQSASSQTIGIADDNSVYGQYIKLSVTTWGSATSWKLSNTSLVVNGLPAQGATAFSNLETNMWLALNILSYGLIIGAVSVFLANRFLGFGG